MAFFKSEEEAAMAKTRADRESEVRQTAKEAGFSSEKTAASTP
jgi:hypothetical protein